MRSSLRKSNSVKQVMISLLLCICINNTIHGQEQMSLDIFKPLIGEWMSDLDGLKVTTAWQLTLDNRVVQRSNSVPAIKQSDETYFHWNEELRKITYFEITNAGWIAHGNVSVEGSLIIFEGDIIKDNGPIIRMKNTLKIISPDRIEDHHYSWENNEWSLQHKSYMDRKK